jgi:hypothetical protein
VLAADPLVDEQGEPREGYRLQIVVLPSCFVVSRNRPDEQRREFDKLRRNKSQALNAAAAALIYAGAP